MEILEEILQKMGCKKPFLNKPITYEDGSRCPLTSEGIEMYEKLVRILFAVGTLMGADSEQIIGRLDDITYFE